MGRENGTFAQVFDDDDDGYMVDGSINNVDAARSPDNLQAGTDSFDYPNNTPPSSANSSENITYNGRSVDPTKDYILYSLVGVFVAIVVLGISLTQIICTGNKSCNTIPPPEVAANSSTVTTIATSSSSILSSITTPTTTLAPTNTTIP